MHLILRCFLILLMLQFYTSKIKGITINFAFSYQSNVTNDRYVYLVTTDKEVILLKNNEFYMHYHRRKIHIPDARNVQEVYILSEKKRKMVYLAIQRAYVLEYRFGRKKSSRILKYIDVRKFLQNKKVDAAGRRGDEIYVFMGCQMVQRLRSLVWDKPKNVKSVGLPCDLNAAWREGDAMILLKGDQIWKWKKGSDAIGPSLFNETYNLKWWTLEPSKV